MKELSLSDSAVREITLLVDQVEQELLNPANVCYFDLLPGQPHKDQISISNLEKLRQVSGKPGVYALWVQNDESTTYRYIGHTAGSYAKTRLRNHFFKKHDKTGAQLSNIEFAILNGYKVRYSYVSIHPPIIRLYVEAVLIDRHADQCIWNIQGKSSRKISPNNLT